MRPRYLHSEYKDESITVNEVFDELVYKPQWFNLDKAKIKTIIDVGAFIGSFTLWAQENWPNAVIHAYEPDPKSYDYLVKNISQVNSKKKIFPHKEAIWESNDQLELYRFSNTPGNNSLIYEKRPFTTDISEKIIVQTHSISDVIKEVEGIDFLKLDCEGSEYKIIYSIPKSQLKKIKLIAIEYHEFDNTSKHTGKILSEYLRKYGFLTQIIPTDIKSGRGLGYIYASSLKKYDKLLQKVFDSEKEKIIKLHKILDEREEYANDLIKSMKQKDSDFNSLNSLVKQKDSDLGELNKLVKRKDVDLKGLNKLVKQKEVDVEGLNKLVKRKDVDLVAVNKLVKQKEVDVEGLNKLVKRKDVDFEELNRLVKKKDIEIQEFLRLVPLEEEELKDLNNVVKQKESEINEFLRLIPLEEEELEELNKLLIQKDVEMKELLKLIPLEEEEINELNNVVKQKDIELEELNKIINHRNNELADLKFELSEIQKSLIFQIMKKISRKIDSSFPNNSKRGEFKKVSEASLHYIQQEGMKKYLSAVKAKASRGEISLITATHSLSSYMPMTLSENDKLAIIKTVHNNRKKRLKIKPHSHTEINNDEFVISDDDKIINGD